MMTTIFRVVLILASFATAFYMLRKIRHSKIQIEDSIFWIIFSGAVAVISVFPKIADFMARSLGIFSTVNFIFLFMIFVLLVRSFSTTIRISQLDNKIKQLTQEIAVKNAQFEKMSECASVSEVVLKEEKVHE